MKITKLAKFTEIKELYSEKNIKRHSYSKIYMEMAQLTAVKASDSVKI